jgi:hypothetical protein
MPVPINSIKDILDNPKQIPDRAGIYYWYFKENSIPHLINLHKCKKAHDNFLLMYVGISPGRANSSQTLQTRVLKKHLGGPAHTSTLRLSLGCLLAETLGIQLRLIGNEDNVKFFSADEGDGEKDLTEWMKNNALISWEEVNEPWNIEAEIIKIGFFPLNLDDNELNENYPILSEIRKKCIDNARRLPRIKNKRDFNI